MYDRVVTINNTHWPAYGKPGATLVDLRMFDPNDRSTEQRLVFRPEKLREWGIPAALIEQQESLRIRFCSGLDDLPDQANEATGIADETTAECEPGGASCPKTCPTR